MCILKSPSRLTLPLLFSLLLLGAETWAGITFTWTGLGDGTSWNEAANWNQNSVPGASDAANFNLGTVNIDDAIINGFATMNVTGGRVNLNNLGNAIPSGNIVVATGATLGAVSSGNASGLSDASVILGGGTMEFIPGGSLIQTGLKELWYNLNPNGNNLRIDPLTVANGESLLNQTPNATKVLDVPLTFNDDASLNNRSGGVTGTDNICALWLGQLNVGVNGSPLIAGDISFGTRSDDGSALYIDLNNNGIFDSPGEMIVNNLGFHGQANQVGTTTLSNGVYRIAIGFFEAGGGAGMHARYVQGVEGNYDNMTIIDPSDAGQSTIWTFETIPSGSLANDVSVLANSHILIGSGVPDVTLGNLNMTGAVTLDIESASLGQPLVFTGATSLSGDAGFNLTGLGTVTLKTISESTMSGLRLSGDGRLILPTANTYTGVTTIDGGCLEVQANGALGDILAGTVVHTNGVLVLNGPAGDLHYTDQEPLELNGNGNRKYAGALSHAAGNNDSYRGPVTLGSDATIYNPGNNFAFFDRLIDNAGFQLRLVCDNNELQIQGSSGLVGSGEIIADGINGRIVTLNNTKNTFDGLLTINNIIWDCRSNDSMGSTNGATIVNSGGRLELRDAKTWGDDITIYGNDNGAGAIRSDNNLNTLTGTVTLGDNAMIWVNPTQLTMTGDLTGPYTAIKDGGGTLVLNGDKTMANIYAYAGALRVNTEGGLGGTTSLRVEQGATIEFDGALTFDGLSTLQGFHMIGSSLSALNGTTTIAPPVRIDASPSVTLSGDGNLIIDSDIGTMGLTTNLAPFALNHYGFHTNAESILDLDQNGGALNNGAPASFAAYFGQAVLTSGPANRGLDFDNDNDFIASGAIGQADNFQNIWIGFFNCNQTGTWGFRNGGGDDRAGIWLDRNTNGIFESSTPGLGSNRDEQLSWEDGGNKQVTLTNGVSYLVAFTHMEYTSGSRVDFRFTPPGGGEAIIHPIRQAGLWSPLNPTVTLGNQHALNKAGNGSVWLNGNNPYTKGTTIDGGALIPLDVQAMGGSGADVKIMSGALALSGGKTFDLGSVEIKGTGGANWMGAIHNIDGDNQLVVTNLYGTTPILSGSSMGIGSAAGTLTVDAPPMELGFALLSFAGAGEVVFNPDILTTEATTVTQSNMLYHFGFHINNDGLAMDLNNNGGMMGGGDPRTFQTFFGLSFLTDGPGGRGLDFNDDNDFINTGSIGQNDNYSNLWLGEFRPNQTGDYGFRREQDDDACGIWFDLNQNGIFESTAPGLGSNRGEQLQWDGDGANKVVSLVAGQRYMIAFTHREGGGGSGVEFRFTPPGGAEVVIKPGDPTQAGLWAWPDLAPVNQVIKNGSGNVILNGNNTHIGETIINDGTLIVPSPAALGTTDAGTIIHGTLAFTNNVTLAGEALWLNGNITSLGGDNVIDVTSIITVSSNALEVGVGAQAGSLTVQGDIDLLSSRLQADGDGDTTLNGIVSGIGSGTGAPPMAFPGPFTFDAAGPTNYSSLGWTVTSGFVGGHNQGDGELGALSSWIDDINPAYAWDNAHPTVLASSPRFLLDGSGDPITFELHGGMLHGSQGANTNVAPTNVSQVLAFANSDNLTGVQGVGLRRVDTGEYVLIASKSFNGGDEDFSLSTVGLPDTAYVFDFFDYYNGGWGWFDLDNLNIPGLNLDEVTLADNSITKTGSGTLTLAAANTYDGATTAWGGILMVTGHTGPSNVVVATGAVLAGNGTVGGDILVMTRGETNPGASPGTLTATGGLAYSDYSSVFNAELDSVASYDQLNVGGAIILNHATLNLIKDPGYSPTASDVLTIATGTSVSGTFNGIAEGDRISAQGAEFVVSYLNNEITLNATAGLYVYAGPDTITRPVGTGVTVPASQLLANDLIGDGVGPLAITGVTTNSFEGGSVSFSGGSITYTPPTNGYDGVDSFTYTVTDGTDSAIGLITVVVGEGTPPSEPPVLVLGGTMQLPNGDYRVAFSGIPGQSYDVEWTNDLTTTPIVWTVLGTVIAAGDGSILLDHAAPPDIVNYYRAGLE
jgi:autotransporter-associated beta strand protein